MKIVLRGERKGKEFFCVVDEEGKKYEFDSEEEVNLFFEAIKETKDERAKGDEH